MLFVTNVSLCIVILKSGTAVSHLAFLALVKVIWCVDNCLILCICETVLTDFFNHHCAMHKFNIFKYNLVYVQILYNSFCMF